MTAATERRIRAVLLRALNERKDSKRSTLALAMSAAAAIKHLHELAHGRLAERFADGKRG